MKNNDEPIFENKMLQPFWHELGHDPLLTARSFPLRYSFALLLSLAFCTSANVGHWIHWHFFLQCGMLKKHKNM